MEQSNEIIILVQYTDKIFIYQTENLWSLPKIKLRVKSTPEEDIGFFFQKKFSVVVPTPKILDVYFSDKNISIIYKLEIDQKQYLKIINSDKKFIWWSGLYGEYQFDEKTRCILDFLTRRGRIDFLNRQPSGIIDNQERYILYTDGGSRGNPGHSAIGFAIYDSNDIEIQSCGEYIGISVSSVAEYQAVLRGLEVSAGMGIKKIELRVDNLMVVKQINGEYQIKNRELWPIHERIMKLKKSFEGFNVVHIKRSFNERADRLVNAALDDYLLNS
ncbi:MAG: ribonuclease HI family protein [Candidatus Saccharibacteria bacterium]|nr:ribonuclease HI family protein [Candidatus Saccharibacteria bacterium]